MTEKNQRFARNVQPPPQPVVPAGMVAALFTERELDALRTICRDSDNESARRILTAGLDRAASKPVIRPVDGLG